MRISDWSSDVCSSDLGTLNHRHVAEVAQVDPAVALLRAVVVPDPGIAGRARIVFAPPFAPTLQHQHLAPRLSEAAGGRRSTEAGADDDDLEVVCHAPSPGCAAPARLTARGCRCRSEGNTSALQSLL